MYKNSDFIIVDLSVRAKKHNIFNVTQGSITLSSKEELVISNLPNVGFPSIGSPSIGTESSSNKNSKVELPFNDSQA